MDSASQDTTFALRGLKLPVELIVTILENLSFEKLFTFDDVDIFQEALVAKLNHRHPLKGKFLASLIKRFQIFPRLVRMDVRRTNEHEMRSLAEILEQCPNFKSLALKVERGHCSTMVKIGPQLLQRLTKLDMNFIESEEDYIIATDICRQCPHLEYLALSLCDSTLGKLKTHLSNIWRLTKVRVFFWSEESFPLLEEICGKYPNLTLKIETDVFWWSIQNRHKILRRLEKMDVFDANVDDFPLLNSICDRYPVALTLRTDECLQELFGYPALLRQLARLELRSVAKEQELVWLSSREKFPKLRRLGAVNLAGLKTLGKCSYLQNKLEYLGVDLFSKEDVLLFNEIREMSHNLQEYEVVMPIHFLQYHQGFQDFPMGKSVVISGDSATISATKCKEDFFDISCPLRHLHYIHKQARSFHLLTMLQLDYFDETDVYQAPALLKKIREDCPNLTSLDIRWFCPNQPSKKSIQLLKDMVEESGIPHLTCFRPGLRPAYI